ncbi:uncharacterized protein LOC113353725 [Papaver somniferum]|uniref:uncharacterized protein LOC113353725 n=1 Tax=Papaver somniferum TaxID=3469 RepID=UPI000E7005BC|nr:uncharacterized protein LOC113353725 [Papaver somniferum]
MQKFDRAEDVSLMSIYCSVVSDLVIARSQDAEILWARIHGEQTTPMIRYPVRTTMMLEQRAGLLKREVKRYVSHVRDYCRDMDDEGYNLETAYREGQLRYEEYEVRRKVWTHGEVFQVLKKQFPEEYGPQFFDLEHMEPPPHGAED